MKRTLSAGLAALALAGLAAGAARAGQYVPATWNSNMSLFVDTATLRGAPGDGPNVVQFWDATIAMRDGSAGGGPHTAYAMGRVEVDCDGQRWRPLAVVTYDVSGSNEPANSSYAPGAWQPVVPDSVAAGELRVVCDSAYRATLRTIETTPGDLVQRLRTYAAAHPDAFAPPPPPPPVPSSALGH